MVFRFWRRYFLFLAAVFLCLGFRVYPGIDGWGLDTSSVAGRKIFITLRSSGKLIENNLPSDDVLSASGAMLTESQLLQTIIDDFNSIQRSNLVLALDSDSDFAAYSTNRRIEIEPGDAAGASSGEAQPTFAGRQIVGCKIKLTEKAYTNAKAYIGLVSHEIGHCVGLEHPQETVWSVMSYFFQTDVYRLAIDDKMGIVHLYPKDPSDASEKATLGLSCAPQ